MHKSLRTLKGASLRCLLLTIHSLVFEAELRHFVGQVKNVAIIEGHMVAIAAEDKQVVLENDSCMAISRSRSLALDVEDLRVGVLANHG
mmetsp:Transcript_32702/g.38445  ORF Transcript_32702/g.38445 Transcript_32702/m.38445 type:complete len:89 (-) Transcript_32702:1458-1724(-)